MGKSIFTLLTLFLAFTSLTAKAQMADRISEVPSMGRSFEAEAVVLTRDMANQLHLNEGEFRKLLPVNRTKLKGLSSIDRMYRGDETERAAKAAELEAQYEQECSRILTPSQLSQLQQEKGNPTATPANSGNGLG